jgi:hypothetical protein
LAQDFPFCFEPVVKITAILTTPRLVPFECALRNQSIEIVQGQTRFLSRLPTPHGRVVFLRHQDIFINAAEISVRQRPDLPSPRLRRVLLAFIPVAAYSAEAVASAAKAGSYGEFGERE